MRAVFCGRVLMKDEGISEALTGDNHFEQAGFKALLKQPPAGCLRSRFASLRVSFSSDLGFSV